MTNERISILGCGWLGMPLARLLIEKGCRIKGSSTREENLETLRDAGIEPFRIILDPHMHGDSPGFLDSDILIVNIPPERRDDIVEYHVLQISSLIDALAASPVKKVLFVSSTSVYPSCNREVAEDDAVDPESATGQALLHVEEMLQAETGFQTTVVRFCGLIGYDRNPARYLHRMHELADPEQPMNLIHRDDCIAILAEIIRQEAWGEVFNACSCKHPLRKEFYGAAAEYHGMTVPPPASAAIPPSYKIINSDKLLEKLDYRFLHPDPLQTAKEPAVGVQG